MTIGEHVKQVVIGVAFLTAQELAAGLRAGAAWLDQHWPAPPREVSLLELAEHIDWPLSSVTTWLSDSWVAQSWPWGTDDEAWLVMGEDGRMAFVAELKRGQVGYRVRGNGRRDKL